MGDAGACVLPVGNTLDSQYIIGCCRKDCILISRHTSTLSRFPSRSEVFVPFAVVFSQHVHVLYIRSVTVLTAVFIACSMSPKETKGSEFRSVGSAPTSQFRGGSAGAASCFTHTNDSSISSGA